MERKPAERVSDATRDRALVQLREHAASGRLELDELEQRSDAILAARTEEELNAARSDLPDLDAWRYRLTHLSLRAHAGLFVAVNAVLLFIWEVTRAKPQGPTDEGAGYWWPFWVLVPWAILLAAHAYRSRMPQRRALPR